MLCLRILCICGFGNPLHLWVQAWQDEAAIGRQSVHLGRCSTWWLNFLEDQTCKLESSWRQGSRWHQWHGVLYHLRLIVQWLWLLNSENLTIVIHTLVTWQTTTLMIFLSHGLPLKTMWKVQLMKSTATRLLLGLLRKLTFPVQIHYLHFEHHLTWSGPSLTSIALRLWNIISNVGNSCPIFSVFWKGYSSVVL